MRVFCNLSLLESSPVQVQAEPLIALAHEPQPDMMIQLATNLQPGIQHDYTDEIYKEWMNQHARASKHTSSDF